MAACHLGHYAPSMGIPRDSRAGSMRSACESRVDLVTCVVIPHIPGVSDFRVIDVSKIPGLDAGWSTTNQPAIRLLRLVSCLIKVLQIDWLS